MQSPDDSKEGLNPFMRPNSPRHLDKRKRQASSETLLMEPVLPPRLKDEFHRPDLPIQPILSSQTPINQVTDLHVPKKEVKDYPVAIRTSTRRTKTTMRWSPSIAGTRDPVSTRRMAKNSGSRRSTSRRILNATRDISFEMLQAQFERPLQQAADHFEVCTTLLKKICRRHGIANWPYRKICGLRKSIASMAKQVNHLDGEQKRAYADQLKRLEYDLQAYIRTGNEATDDFIRAFENQQKEKVTERKEENETLNLSLMEPKLEPLYHIKGDRSLSGDEHFRPPALQVQTPTYQLPSIAVLLQHQSYLSPSRAASTQNLRKTTPRERTDELQKPLWRYFPPANNDAS